MREKLPDLSELHRDPPRPSTNIIFEQEGLWQAPVCSSSSVARRAEGFSQDVLNSKHVAKLETTPVSGSTCRLLKIDSYLAPAMAEIVKGQRSSQQSPGPSALSSPPPSFPLLPPAILFSTFISVLRKDLKLGLT